MSSRALAQLYDGLSEIDALQRANASPAEGSGLSTPEVTRAIGRAEVVLLCSHLERYVYAVFEESIEALVVSAVRAADVPSEMKLLDARGPIDELAQTNWDRRGDKLVQFISTDAELWRSDAVLARLDHERVLAWMKSPAPKQLERAFRLWGIEKVFSVITRSPIHRQRIWLKIQDLVDKRNNIAHGDFTAEATYLDIRDYQLAVKQFCDRVDRQMRLALLRIPGIVGPPW